MMARNKQIELQAIKFDQNFESCIVQYKIAGNLKRYSERTESNLSPQLTSLISQIIKSPSTRIPYKYEMEQLFGVEFTHVRAHVGIEAREAARQLGAQAFMFGNKVVFGSEKPSRWLVAHELTHILQQSDQGRGTPALPDRVCIPDCPEEREAHRISDMLVSGNSIQFPVVHASSSTIYTSRRMIERGLYIIVFRWVDLPRGRAPSVVDIDVTTQHGASDEQVRERIVVALRTQMTSQQADRASELTRDLRFRAQLQTHLQRERLEWQQQYPHARAAGRPIELWIPVIFVHRQTGSRIWLDSSGRPRIDRLEIDQSRYPPPLPVPPTPPTLDEVFNWPERLVEDETVDPKVREMARMMMRQDTRRRLDGKYLNSGQVWNHCQNSACSQATIEQGCSDVNNIPRRAIRGSIGTYRQFKLEFEAVGPALQAGFDELHRIHSAEATRIEVVSGPDVHAWFGRRQRNDLSLYHLFEITTCGWGSNEPCIQNASDFSGG